MFSPRNPGQGVGFYLGLIQWLSDASKDPDICHPHGVMIPSLGMSYYVMLTPMSRREESHYVLIASFYLDTKQGK